MTQQEADPVPDGDRSKAQPREPKAYVVPLRDEHSPAHSYVLAVTRWLDEEEVAELLPAAAGFTGHDIPFRTDEVIRLPLNVVGIRKLPLNLFARDLLTEFGWTSYSGSELIAAFIKRYKDRGHLIGISSFTIVLREGQRPNGPMGMPEGEFALWRDARATIYVDLDDLLREDAFRALHLYVGDLAAASGVLAHERAILEGRSQKWDKAHQRLHSNEETLESYQLERIAVLDQLGDLLFQTPVDRHRYRAVYGQAVERAEELGHSESEEWREGRRRNLLLVASSLLTAEIEAIQQRITEAPPRQAKKWQPEFEAFRTQLVHKLKAALNEAMTQDYLDDPAWRRKVTKQEVELDERVETSDSDLRDWDLEPVPTSVEELLGKVFGKELIGRAHLTPTEKRVLGAISELEDDDSLEQWAQRNGMKPATARVHKFNAKNKIAEAMKLT
jgi:hypothetical protein